MFCFGDPWVEGGAEGRGWSRRGGEWPVGGKEVLGLQAKVTDLQPKYHRGWGGVLL